MAWVSGAVCGALMVSLHSARSQTVSVSSGGFAAFDRLEVKPPPAVAAAEKTLAEAELRPAYVPKHELNRQRRREENSPRAVLAALRAQEEESA